MNHLEIKHLRMIEAITKTNNMTKAAKKLYITQSALSQQLKDIEDKLETELFFRTGRKMILTRIGKKLLDRARVIIDEIDRAELEVVKAVNGEKGEIKIGVRCLFCYKWIPDLLKDFQDKYPNVDIEIGNSTYPEEDLISEKCDIAISGGNYPDKRISHTPIFKDEMICVMNTDHRLSYKKYLVLQDFHGSDIISLVDKSKHSFYQSLLYNRGIKPRRYMTIAHPEAMVDLIEAGLGIGILPKWFILPQLNTRELYACPLTPKGTKVQWKAAYLKGKNMPSYQKEFMKLMTSREITNV